MFGLLHLVFYVFALVAYTNNAEAAEVNGIGEYGFAILASFLVDGLVNMYVLCLSTLWFLILVIILLLSALLCCCACNYCCLSIFCYCFFQKEN